LKKVSDAFGKILRLGGTKIAQVIEADLKEANKWLRQD
jgi:hypothetical protein